jgi:hypothetical protein
MSSWQGGTAPVMTPRDRDQKTESLRYSFWYATVALGTATVCIVCGTVLFLAGISGKVAWATRALGFTSEIKDAGPGIIFVIVGFLIVWVTRLRPPSRR